MLPRFICALSGLLLFVGGSSAFEVEATIKRVDVEKGVLVFHARGQDRTARVDKDAKILDEAGKPLADGLKAKQLKEGATVILTVERVDDKPVIKAIKLGKKTDKPAPTEKIEKQDTSKLIAIPDLGKDKYQGFQGGLYPEGKNERPEAHEAAGRALAKEIQPLDVLGKPNANGKIVHLGIGFSNTVQAFNGFMQVAKGDKEINPKIVLVNGAVGAMSAFKIQNPDDKGSGT